MNYHTELQINMIYPKFQIKIVKNLEMKNKLQRINLVKIRKIKLNLNKIYSY